MTTKKQTTKNKKRRAKAQLVRVHGDVALPLYSDNGRGHKQPLRTNPTETDEQREKRLAARKALTLKAARIAYENHHRRKLS